MRRLTLVLVAALALVLPVTLGGAVAQAAQPGLVASQTTYHHVTRHYVHNWVFRSTKLKRCVSFEVEGDIAATWRYAYGDSSSSADKDTLDWTNIRLLNPTIHATGWPISGAGCDSTRRWAMKAQLSQGWFQSRCGLKVSVSVGFPWSVGAAPEYSCSTGRVGHRTSTEGRSTRTLSQFNSGAPIHFSETLASVKAGGIGFRGVVSVRMHTRNASDLVRRSVSVTLNK